MSALDVISSTPTIVATETVEESNSAPINPIPGIIYPPPEVRNIVDKTASFVARNGPEFEARIRQNEINNPKFNFLNTGDPYYGYYQRKVADFREGKSHEITSGLSSAVSKLSVSASAQQKQQEILKAAVEKPFVPQDPPAEFEFIADPPSISALDLDIVKLTAQFVARNGRQFLTQLMNREQRNFQFDFLRPQHSLFQYFTKLLEQYTKVLIPPKSLQNRLREEAKTAQAVLEQVKYRAEWHKYQEAQKAKEEEILERERVAYAQIDWHDFVVVETVDYQQFEIGNFPPPTTPEEVGARLLIQERIEDGEDIEMQLESDDEEEPVARNPDEGLSRMEDRTMGRKGGRDDNRVQDMEQDSSDEESEPKTQSHQTIQPLLPPVPDKVVVKKYDPKNAPKVTRPLVGDDYLISPITGEKIPASKVQEHMKIGLLDPRWIEQRDKLVTDKMNQDTVYAAGSAIDASLKQLAERRTDIFGIGDEETAIGKKIGEEDVRKDEKVTWDGHTSSVEAATRAARANITLEEQIHQIHKVKGLLPDEEKEKIGPKNVLNKGLSKAAAVITGKPQSNPNPTPVKPPQTIAPPQQPPQMSMVMQTQQALLANQTQIMMMPAPPMAPMRPPPLMMAAPPPMGGFVTPMPPHMVAANMGMKRPMDMEEEPMGKKLRNEDSLIPEEVFLARNPNPVALKVSIPLQPEKAEWKLAGQMLQFTMPLSESIAALKSKVQDDTSMPPAKQKLFFDGMFFKDSNTLAYYNITSGAVIHLQIKERGGRKK